MDRIDLLVCNASELLTFRNDGPKKGAALENVDIIEEGAVAVDGGRIVETGPTPALKKKYRAAEIVDAQNRVVLPGFVDPHTHPVFGATRESEFDMRLRGKTYV